MGGLASFFLVQNLPFSLRMQSSNTSKDSSSQRMCSHLFPNMKTLADTRALSDVPIESFSADQVGQDEHNQQYTQRLLHTVPGASDVPSTGVSNNEHQPTGGMNVSLQSSIDTDWMPTCRRGVSDSSDSFANLAIPPATFWPSSGSPSVSTSQVGKSIVRRHSLD